MIRDKRLGYALLAYALGVLLLALPRCAQAEEPVPPEQAASTTGPCRDEGASVVCDGEAFRRLVHKLLDYKAAAETCQRELQACRETPPPTPPPCPVAVPAPAPKRSRVRPAMALVLGAASGAAATAGATLDAPAGRRAGLVVAGVLGLCGATLLVTW